jgi:hypothetical protein
VPTNLSTTCPRLRIAADLICGTSVIYWPDGDTYSSDFVKLRALLDEVGFPLPNDDDFTAELLRDGT